MLKRIINGLSYLLLLLLLLFSCTGRKGAIGTIGHPTSNSIYYWKTTFTLNDYEQSFLREHDIHRMYVKFFDVDDDAPSQYVDAKRILPVATTVFSSPRPEDVEIIPTVYLTIRAISFMGQSENGVQESARKIVTHVRTLKTIKCTSATA